MIKKVTINIKKFREKSGITQKEMAKMMRISQPTFSKYENGNKIPSLERLIEIAVILETNLDDLVDYRYYQNKVSKELKKLEKEA